MLGGANYSVSFADMFGLNKEISVNIERKNCVSSHGLLCYIYGAVELCDL